MKTMHEYLKSQNSNASESKEQEYTYSSERSTHYTKLAQE